MKARQQRRIAVITGSRADYGLLKPLLNEINKDTNCQLQLVVCGMHLHEKYGLTINDILQDGFDISWRVITDEYIDTTGNVARSIGSHCELFPDVFEQLRPDLVIVLGDRTEILSAAISAYVMNIPIAHLHGGELTEGAIDDGIRHSITKMSSLHFVSTKQYRERVIQLGEMPNSVFNVGAIGLDNLVAYVKPKKKDMEALLNCKLKDKVFLVTYHPVTANQSLTNTGIDSLVEALKLFSDISIIITGVNNDANNEYIFNKIKELQRESAARITYVKSLGSENYLKLLSLSNVVIGNSSSGIIEAPELKTPTVNIGDRQKGRIKADSVIDVCENTCEIVSAINKALSASFIKKMDRMTNPYGNGGTAKTIFSILNHIDFENLLPKRFYDLPTN